ncbi:helicase ARIP4 isoform X2 [Hydra vulgaris]|uniref:Helicase ARIP4 isoform X2 n=2 Tax=Hydra vulgaris TaxID=6087 RepID=A0ABM4C5N6_HYDVU
MEKNLFDTQNIVTDVIKELCDAVESDVVSLKRSFNTTESEMFLSKRICSKNEIKNKAKCDAEEHNTSEFFHKGIDDTEIINMSDSQIIKKKNSLAAKLKKRGLRRNIRKVIGDKQLEFTTQTLREKELARLNRLGAQSSSKELNVDVNSKVLFAQKKVLKNYAETICLDSDSDDQIVTKPVTKSTETICILSTDSEEEEYSSDVISSSDRKPQSEIYYSELGLHTNDLLNIGGVHGNILVNVNHPSTDPDILIPKHLENVLKPHQIGGIRFLYDNLIETTSDFKLTHGNGCILAHAMGLGKTIQTITFIDIFLRHTCATKVLCVVPVNTVQNWMNEFNMWMPPKPEKNSENFDISVKDLLDAMVEWVSSDNDIESWDMKAAQILPTDEDKNKNCTMFRDYKVYLIDSQKNLRARANFIGEWEKTGGVLLIGYEMYRSIALYSSKSKISKVKKGKGSSESVVFADLKRALCKPGPDLVICDEGHRIRNYQSGVSQALKSIKTRKRLVLTGYPLQNNLVEYWCMVDFVRPNYLGSRHEFSNMFERPIMNGQCFDSTEKDKHLMRQRAHVLYSLLKGFVQRRGHNVLKTALPPKEENVLVIRLSPVQKALYKKLIDTTLCYESMNPIKTFSLCVKIWNHPDILYKAVCANQQGKQLEILCDEDDIAVDDSIKMKRVNKPTHESINKLNEENKISSAMEDILQNLSSWAGPLFNSYMYVPGKLENSGKFLVLNKIIQESMARGDKMLIFSQSLLTLNSIEEFLQNIPIKNGSDHEKKYCWKKGRDYFRLDGSTSTLEREKLIRLFNSKDNKHTNIFLLSTRAGCLGINLIAANRVVVFDVSWNPCHDAQAVCRVYRYGQEKPCHIYRLVASNTMEKKIYYRQISKQGISDRVVDEQSLTENFSKREIQSLVEEEWCDEPVLDYSKSIPRYNDHILRNILRENPEWITELPFKHESLLINEDAGRLTAIEKQEAKRAYEKERSSQMNCRSFPLQPCFPSDSPIVPVRPFLWRPPIYQPLSNPSSVLIPEIYKDVLSSSNFMRQRMNSTNATKLSSNLLESSKSSSTNQDTLYGFSSSYPASSFGSLTDCTSTLPRHQKVIIHDTLLSKNLYSAEKEVSKTRDNYLASPINRSTFLKYSKKSPSHSLFDEEVLNADESIRNAMSSSPLFTASQDHYSRELNSLNWSDHGYNDTHRSDNIKNDLSVANLLNHSYSNSRFSRTLPQDMVSPDSRVFSDKAFCSNESQNSVPLKNIFDSIEVSRSTNQYKNICCSDERSNRHLLPFQTKVSCDEVIILDD